MDSKWQSRPTGRTVAVAEHPPVHLAAETRHLASRGVGWQLFGLVVEGFDFFRDGEVLVGHGAVGDPGIHHGHAHPACALEVVPDARPSRADELDLRLRLDVATVPGRVGAQLGRSRLRASRRRVVAIGRRTADVGAG